MSVSVVPSPIATLLTRALCHRSWCAESPGGLSNERLEFLGDSVLGLVVTAHLYRTYPDLPEGHLAQVRAAVVERRRPGRGGHRARLGEAIRLGKGEDSSGGREKPSILSDAMEAVIGAVYLDGGWGEAEILVMDMLGDRMTEAAAGPGGHDFKTRLQELAARRFEALPFLRRVVRGSRPRQAVHGQGVDRRARASAWARAGRRSRPSRRPPGWPGGGCRSRERLNCFPRRLRSQSRKHIPEKHVHCPVPGEVHLDA